MEIKGSGPAKVGQCGEGLLSVREDHHRAIWGREPVAATSDEEILPRTEKRADDSEKTSPKPTHYWTWRLFDAGFSAGECMAIRNIDRQTLLKHALQAAEGGNVVAPKWCLSPETLATLEAAFASANPHNLESVMLRLSDQIGAHEVKLFLTYLAGSEDETKPEKP